MRAKTSKPWLLVADDDEIILKLISIHCDHANIRTKCFSSGEELLLSIDDHTRVCLLDLHMDGMSGISCLKIIKEKFPHVEVIIATTINEASEAVTAIKAGAFDYLTKPLEPVELINAIRNAYEIGESQHNNEALKYSFSMPVSDINLSSKSPSMKLVISLVEKIATINNVVLLTGESGTGKTYLAQKIHQLSNRRDQAFISVSCPSLPKELLESEMFGHEKGAFSGAVQKRLGRVELADKGTLFLDEIGELSLETQAKLLTFIQDQKFYRVGGEEYLKSDVRIITATNRDLWQMVQKGLFREDLYYRLNVLPLEMPPLSKRREDIPELIDKMIQKVAKDADQAPPVMEDSCLNYLQSLPWNGNIRELENTLIRAYTFRKDSMRIAQQDFNFLRDDHDASSTSPVDETNANFDAMNPSWLGISLAEAERKLLEANLDFHQGNKSLVSKSLGISEKSVYNKIKKYNIDY